MHTAIPAPSFRLPRPGGLALTVLIAVAAFGIHALPHMGAVSPAILATVIGMVLAHTLHIPASAEAGISFASRTLLRGAVVLLGLQVSVAQIAAVGVTGFAIGAAGLFTSFMVIRALGCWLGVEARLAELIAAGTSICGASAVAAVNTVTEAADEDVAYAIAMVTLFGTAAMLVYPLAAPWLGEHRFGLWAGASIHEVAQVVGATAGAGPQAQQTGAVAKLSRILLLAPLVMGLSLWRRAGKTQAGGKMVGVPLFVLGFLALVAVNSLMPVPAGVKTASGQVSAFLLAMALGGMGLKTHLRAVTARGWKPIALAAAGAVFISLFTLGLIVALT
ncbi:YeiH family protein [Asticcacaulis sp. 201]|uniref:YeiH family protein n=1 Tax=Asticcacaulis sp. 201 TaxID=3028787 RepID=UPI002915D647|nr:putative sulfate exporter family transporter [Asticcacaulis sp. 201]MDV6330209.1 putative sulfate exporter family transporter [Asticcacaulis sp. 201]